MNLKDAVTQRSRSHAKNAIAKGEPLKELAEGGHATRSFRGLVPRLARPLHGPTSAARRLEPVAGWCRPGVDGKAPGLFEYEVLP